MNEEERNKHIERKTKKIMGTYLAVFLAFMILISLYINMASFQKQFISSELSFYSVSGSRVVDRIENGLLFGKSLEKFYGIDRIFQEWTEKNSQVINLKLFATDKKTVLTQMNEREANRGADADDSIMLEIRDSDGILKGYLNIVVDLNECMDGLFQKQLIFIGGAVFLMLMGTGAIFVFCIKSSFVTAGHRIERKKILLFMLPLLLVLQTAFTVYSFGALRNAYLELFNHTGKEIRLLVQDDINKVIQKGVTFDQIHDFDSYAKDVTDNAPMIDSITLEDGELHVTTSKKYLKKLLYKLLADLLTVLVTSLFITVEMINYMMMSANRKVGKIHRLDSYDKMLSIRVVSFLIHVACYLPVSFIPIMMYQFTGGRASDFLLGLPVMVLFAAGFAFTLVAGGWSQRFGWKRLLLAGVFLLVASSLFAGLFANAMVLILARGIYGASYALIYVAIREFAAAGAGREDQSKGFSQVNAGLYAGVNIGAVLGSIIYESVGYQGVFLISALIGILSALVVKQYCNILPGGCNDRKEGDSSALHQISAAQSKAGFMTVIRNREMIRLALLIIVPLSITSLFFEYFLPVYAVKADISSADIGRAFLINGIAVAYGAPWMIKHIPKRFGERVRLFLFALLMGGGFILFGLVGGVAGILLSSAVMGIAEGAALVSQNMVMLDLSVAKKAGTSRMLSIYAIIRRLAQTAGPQVFAAFMILGTQLGMIAMGSLLSVFSLRYLMGGRLRRGGSYGSKR